MHTKNILCSTSILYIFICTPIKNIANTVSIRILHVHSTCRTVHKLYTVHMAYFTQNIYYGSHLVAVFNCFVFRLRTKKKEKKRKTCLSLKFFFSKIWLVIKKGYLLLTFLIALNFYFLFIIISIFLSFYLHFSKKTNNKKRMSIIIYLFIFINK